MAVKVWIWFCRPANLRVLHPAALEFPIPAETDSKHTAGIRTLLLTDGLTCRVHILSNRVTKILQAKAHDVNSGARETNQLVSQGEAMTFPTYRTIRPLLALLLAFLMACAANTPAWGQEKKVAQQNGVDNSKMGAYRALAQHVYADFQKGDLAAAALMAKVLERVWDKAEDYGGDTALSKTNHGLFEQIDKAMDDFISLITDAKGKPPDPPKVKAAFSAYLEKLKLAD